MRRIIQRCGLAAFMFVAALSASLLTAEEANAQCRCSSCLERHYGSPDLFYNYYVPPTCGGVGSSLYVSPGPIPPSVGHTYITYQPLMPHEFMYPHYRTYYRYYNGGRGMTRTNVKYGNVPVLSRVHTGLSFLRIAR